MPKKKVLTRKFRTKREAISFFRKLNDLGGGGFIEKDGRNYKVVYVPTRRKR